MFQSFIKFISKARKSRFDDDGVDRLNSYYTPLVLGGMAILVASKQYVGQPIQCWIPAQFTSAMEDYTEDYCWVQNTWFLRLKSKSVMFSQIPLLIDERESEEIVYYQWVPFILLLQAVISVFPAIVWRQLNGASGFDMNILGQMASEARPMTDEQLREKHVEALSVYIEEIVWRLRRPFWRRSQGCLWRVLGRLETYLKGYYVTTLYLLVKLLYIGSIAVQFHVLQSLLAINSPTFGWDVVNDLLQGTEWHKSGLFPRVTMCDFEVKVMGNLHRHTVQCVLMINMFNEKIFVFIWFWLSAMLLSTIASFTYWLFTLLPYQRARFVRHHLRRGRARPQDVEDGEGGDAESRRLLRAFVDGHLGQDGAFVLRHIAARAGPIVLDRIVRRLWQRYLINSEEDERFVRLPFDKQIRPFTDDDKPYNGQTEPLRLPPAYNIDTEVVVPSTESVALPTPSKHRFAPISHSTAILIDETGGSVRRDSPSVDEKGGGRRAMNSGRWRSMSGREGRRTTVGDLPSSAVAERPEVARKHAFARQLTAEEEALLNANTESR